MLEFGTKPCRVLIVGKSGHFCSHLHNIFYICLNGIIYSCLMFFKSDMIILLLLKMHHSYMKLITPCDVHPFFRIWQNKCILSSGLEGWRERAPGQPAWNSLVSTYKSRAQEYLGFPFVKGKLSPLPLELLNKWNKVPQGPKERMGIQWGIWKHLMPCSASQAMSVFTFNVTFFSVPQHCVAHSLGW